MKKATHNIYLATNLHGEVLFADFLLVHDFDGDTLFRVAIDSEFNLTKSALADLRVQRVLSDMCCGDAGRLWQILQSLRSMLRKMWQLVLVVLRYLVVLEMLV